MITTSKVNQSLKEMLNELASVRNNATYLLNKLSTAEPETFVGAGRGELPEDAKNLDMTDSVTEMDEKPGEMKGEETQEIKTPEEAKKTLNEAITDLKSVVEGIDNITEQGKEMEEKTSSKTFRLSSKVQDEIGILTRQAIAAIDDANNAIRHWSFLLRKSSSSSTKKSPLQEVVNSVKEAKTVWQELGKVFSTAVPPTGAQFTGDKGIDGDVYYSAKKELKHFQSGYEEYKKDKEKEDKLPNAASEPRLVDEGNPHELSAYVNAKAVKKNNVFSSAIVVRALNKDRKGKYAVVTWDKLSPVVGEKTAENYEIFLSPLFAKNVEYQVRRNGIDAVAAYLNADVDVIGLSATSEREPRVKDKEKLRQYYKDAFGDAEFARELTSNKKKSDLGAGINEDYAEMGVKSGDEMNVNYEPELEADDVEGGLEGGNDENSVGSGSPDTTASLEVRKAKARMAVDFSRLAASRGLIPFTKSAIASYAQKVVSYDDAKFQAQKELIESMPLVNEAALKEARIPENEETESGIIANTHEAVRNPQNQNVSTEGVSQEVRDDAKIARTAAIVPQLHVNSSLQKESFINYLDTYTNRLRKMGLDPESESFRKVRPHYRKR